MLRDMALRVTGQPPARTDLTPAHAPPPTPEPTPNVAKEPGWPSEAPSDVPNVNTEGAVRQNGGGANGVCNALMNHLAKLDELPDDPALRARVIDNAKAALKKAESFLLTNPGEARVAALHTRLLERLEALQRNEI
jgi:hypothetical protein